MNIKIIDNRTGHITSKCDAVIEEVTENTVEVIKGFVSQDIISVLDYAMFLNKKVIIYLYDVNSKPLK
jgi:hypothetical protein